MAIKESRNYIEIEGVLAENNLEKATFTKNNKDMDCIRGEVIVKVDENLIPVRFFTAKYKTDGNLNKIYSSLEQTLNLVSLTSAPSEDLASYVQIRGARLRSNNFVNRQGTEIVENNEINSNFLTQISKTQCKNIANFSFEIYIIDMADEVDKEGVSTGRFVVTGGVFEYGDRIAKQKIIIDNPDYIKAFKLAFDIGDCTEVSGYINYRTVTRIVEEEAILGTIQKEYTNTVKEFILTAAKPKIDPEFGWTADDFATATAFMDADNKSKLEKKAVSTEKKVDNIGF